MPRFHYKAQTPGGQMAEGDAEAKDKFDLAHKLKDEGKSILFANELHDRRRSLIARLESAIGSVSLRDRLMFMRNLGAMIEAGLPIARALGILVKQTNNKKFKRILEETSRELSKGSSFSEALSKHPNVFSALAVSMVKAGEESGNLPESLRLVAEQLERSYLLRRRVRGAMTYPSIVIFAMIAVGALMMIYIVPTLAGVFEELGVELPATTQAIISLSDFLRENTLTAILLFSGVLFLLYMAGKSRHGKRVFEIILLRMPVIGELVRQVNSARTGRTLSSLLGSGVSMVESLSITRDVVQNTHFKDILRDAGERVQKGTPLSRVLSENEKYYPVMVGEMVAVGEETGQLSDMLLKVATFYEGEVEQKTKDLSTVIEPVLMVVVGAGVGFFAISMITPLYSVLEGI